MEIRNIFIGITILLIMTPFPNYTHAQCTVDDLLVPYNDNPHGYRSQAEGASITIGSSNNPSWLPGAESYIELAANEWNIAPDAYTINGGAASNVVWQYTNYEGMAGSPAYADIFVESDGEVSSFTIYVNATEFGSSQWSTDCSDGTWDVFNVMIHEVGHVLGLADVSDCTDQTVMGPGSMSEFDCDAGLLSLDEAAIKKIYGDDPAAVLTNLEIEKRG